MGQAMHQELFKRLLAALIGVELAVFVVCLRASQLQPLGILPPDLDLAAEVLMIHESKNCPATVSTADEDETDLPPEEHESAMKPNGCPTANLVATQARRAAATCAE
jgi:hypothetical protein